MVLDGNTVEMIPYTSSDVPARVLTPCILSLKSAYQNFSPLYYNTV